jgi:hypothetical protein
MKTRRQKSNVTLPAIEDIDQEHWSALVEQRILFGHQSVGYNIVDGIKDIINEHSHIEVNIVETQERSEFDRPVFAHCRVGRNTDPASKIESFTSIMDAGVGNKVDIAFFKFCYVDLVRGSDPEGIFHDYEDAIGQLKVRYSQTKFLHVTVPICSAPRTAKRALKESAKFLVGKPGFIDDNVVRQRYNMLLEQAYSGNQPMFDLALIESVDRQGFRCYTTKGTNTVFLLAPEYTEDASHLNERGRKRVAEQLLIVLAKMAHEG